MEEEAGLQRAGLEVEGLEDEGAGLKQAGLEVEEGVVKRRSCETFPSTAGPPLSLIPI